MQTVTAHISRRCRPLVASAVLVLAIPLAVVSHAPNASGHAAGAGAAFTQTRIVAHRRGARPSYRWPLKPFNRQHPVRGYLNDPRNGHHARSFHFGIDISAPDGTAVYAVEAGEVFHRPGRHALAVRGATRTFGYWHVVPVVRDHQMVHVHELLGHVARGGAHVHLAERLGDAYLNPLRPGGIGPYIDRTPPTVVSVEFFRNGHVVAADALIGRVDIVTETIDTTPLLVPRPWSKLPVTPARIRWAIVCGPHRVVAQRTAADFRRVKLPDSLYASIYAAGTRQNRARHPGHYRFSLAHGFDTSLLSESPCRLRIEADDTRGNLAVADLDIARANA